MINIYEYLLSKSTQITPTIKAKDATLHKIVHKEIEDKGLDCNLNHIDVSKCTNFNSLFEGTHGFNGIVSEWDVSNAVSMEKMFASTDFQGDLSEWNVEKVENMENMFAGCEHFNSDISGWKTKMLTKARNMFDSCFEFDQDLSKWDVSKITFTACMFKNCYKFNHNVGNFNFYSADELSAVFKNCKDFDQDVSNLLKGKLKVKISHLFLGCENFTGKGLDQWNTKALNYADKAFQNCMNLDADISEWDMHELMSAESMFEGCKSLTADCSKWTFKQNAVYWGNYSKMFMNSGVPMNKRPEMVRSKNSK